MTTDVVEKQKGSGDAGLVEHEKATTESTDSRHGVGEFAQKMAHMPVGYAQDGHGELPGVHEHVRVECCHVDVG